MDIANGMSSRSRNSGRGSSGKPRGHDGDRIGAEDLGTERRREDSGKDTSRKEDFVKHGKSQKNKHPRYFTCREMLKLTRTFPTNC